MATYTYRLQMRRDSAADWTSNAPTLASGEWGYEDDTGKLKIGDGSTAWASLLYFPVDTDGQIYLLDDKKVILGTGLDGEIYVSSDDVCIRNVTSNKDIIISVNDGGVQTTVLTIDADVACTTIDPHYFSLHPAIVDREYDVLIACDVADV